MQACRLVIPGRFWDSHIYKGKLYLFGVDQSILTVDWDSLIEHVAHKTTERSAFLWAFKMGDYLYDNRLTNLLGDRDLINLLASKFKKLAASAIEPSKTLLKEFSRKQDNQFPFPHSDSTIYYKVLYVAGRSGLFSAKTGNRTKYPISTRVQKEWDCPILNLSGSYDNLALACGGDGLFMKRVWNFSIAEPKKVLDNSPVDCKWLRQNVLSISRAQPSAILMNRRGDHIQDRIELDRTLRLEGEAKTTWGNVDRFYMMNGHGIEVTKIQNDRRRDTSELKALGSADGIAGLKSRDVLLADNAIFGSIIETVRNLHVITSDGKVLTFEGDTVRWRVFPRSVHYINQMHVIYKDRLEVLSFNHDYVIPQDSKILGAEYFSNTRSYGARETVVG